MSVVKYPRITLGLGLAAALLVTTVTASQRQAAAMATAANAFLVGSDSRATAAGGPALRG